MSTGMLAVHYDQHDTNEIAMNVYHISKNHNRNFSLAIIRHSIWCPTSVLNAGKGFQ